MIDHIFSENAEKLDIPILDGKEFDLVSGYMKDAVALLERARLQLAGIQDTYEGLLPRMSRTSSMADGWTVRSRKLTGRLDAASYDPLVARIRTTLRRAGGKQLDEVATVLKPAGRYKTHYVSAEHGTPMLSGTQLLQHTPINLQYLAARTLKNRRDYEVKAGWLAYQADGRAEETLGLPIMITPDREDWLASGHVGRVIAKRGTNPGWLCVALRTPHCQAQIKSLASGSVVDSTFPSDMESVVLPPPIDGIRWSKATEAWYDFAKVTDLENKAIRLLERKLTNRELRLT